VTGCGRRRRAGSGGTPAAETTSAWHRAFAPNTPYLPGGASSSDPLTYIKDIVNDVAIDPRNANHVIAAIGRRGGDSYNGFSETTDGGTTWSKANPGGRDQREGHRLRHIRVLR
jgi:hypothetical protein